VPKVRIIFIFLGVFLLNSPVTAVTLDWDLVDWTSGNLTQSFDIDPGNAGNDITITISGDTGQIKSPHSGANFSPDDNTLAAGGFAEETLLLSVDFNNDNGVNFLTVTINFLYAFGVNNAAFVLTDVDQALNGTQNFIDVMSNWNASLGGGAGLFPTLTNSADNIIGGTNGTSSVFAQGVSGNPDPDAGGNVGVSFSTTLDTISFRYTSGDIVGNPGGGTNPTSQSIGLYDITYTPAVPEASSLAMAGLLFLTVLGNFTWRQRHRFFSW
jgi:hypothetical protein